MYRLTDYPKMLNWHSDNIQIKYVIVIHDVNTFILKKDLRDSNFRIRHKFILSINQLYITQFYNTHIKYVFIKQSVISSRITKKHVYKYDLLYLHVYAQPTTLISSMFRHHNNYSFTQRQSISKQFYHFQIFAFITSHRWPNPKSE